MLREGFYKVSFATPLGNGTGLVVVKATTVQGGDLGYTYKGNIGMSVDGGGAGQIQADLLIKRYDTEATSVFGPLQHFRLQLMGTFTLDSFSAQGTADEMPGVTISVKGAYVDSAL